MADRDLIIWTDFQFMHISAKLADQVWLLKKTTEILILTQPINFPLNISLKYISKAIFKSIIDPNNILQRDVLAMG